MKRLSPVWFLENYLDEEYQTYIILDYVQAVKRDVKEMKLRYLFDVKYHIQNLESFIATRGIVEDEEYVITPEQEDLLLRLLEHPDGSEEMCTALKICENAVEHLRSCFLELARVYRMVQANLYSMSIGDRPKNKKEGFVVFRNAVSDFVEVYKFKKKSRSIMNMKLFKEYKYDDSKMDYMDIRSVLIAESKKENPLFVVVESANLYNTKETLVPIMSRILAVNFCE